MSHKRKLDIQAHKSGLLDILHPVIASNLNKDAIDKLVRTVAKRTGINYGRDELIRAYREFSAAGELPPFDAAVIERLRMKPVRTISGVTPVTVLTKPFPCPGECIFCPNDVRMPKSYLSDEPGAQRAEQNSFDPYLQTYTRLQAYDNIGHPTDKIEVIVLGGTWSFYPETYQIWFIKRIFDALHDFGRREDRRREVNEAVRAASQLHPETNHANVIIHGVEMAQTYNQAVQRVYDQEMQRSRAAALTSEAGGRSPVTEFATWDELEAAHRENETAPCRCVGLVIETRPDHISEDEVRRIRRLGCTKVQIGFQSLSDAVLRKNRRGHTVAASRRAVRLLRAGGFKIHAHWMPNLYGSSPTLDREDYRRLFDDPDFRPDELKIYPCSLIESAELMKEYQAGRWHPYTHEELLDLLVDCFEATPEYCRLTRVIRDIPGGDIVAGNQITNFRQLVENALHQRGGISRDIRAREVKFRPVHADQLVLDAFEYETSWGREIFLQFIAPDRAIAAFLRLSLPDLASPPLVEELTNAAMIREVHVYGQSVEIGEQHAGAAQHAGLGRALIDHAAALAQMHGYATLAVISAVGTRDYYRKRGFMDGNLYQRRDVSGGVVV